MKIRKVITADDGLILTNGEIYGRVIFLADEQSAEEFHEITDEEYKKIIRDHEEAVLGEGGLE